MINTLFNKVLFQPNYIYEIKSFSFFVILIFSGSFSVKAQETNQNSIEFSPQISLDFFPDKFNISGNVYGGEIIFHQKTNKNSQEWQQKLHLNSLDYIFNFNNFKYVKKNTEPNKFSNSYAVLAALNFTILKYKSLQVNFSPAAGIGYTEKTYYVTGNELIGSPFNIYFRAALKAEVPLSSNTKIVTGINVLHLSNAALRVPNHGVNFSSLSLGLAKKISSRQTQNKDSLQAESEDVIANKHRLELAFNVGRRGIYQSKHGLYKTAVYGGYNYKINKVIGLGTGIDAVYYHTIYDPNNNNHTYQSKASSYKRWRIGTAIGPDLWLGNLAVSVKYGYYLYFDSLSDVSTYWTPGFSYKLTNWFALQTKGYIHKTEADYAGIGFMFQLL